MQAPQVDEERQGEQTYMYMDYFRGWNWPASLCLLFAFAGPSGLFAASAFMFINGELWPFVPRRTHASAVHIPIRRAEQGTAGEQSTVDEELQGEQTYMYMDYFRGWKWLVIMWLLFAFAGPSGLFAASAFMFANGETMAIWPYSPQMTSALAVHIPTLEQEEAFPRPSDFPRGHPVLPRPPPIGNPPSSIQPVHDGVLREQHSQPLLPPNTSSREGVAQTAADNRSSREEPQPTCPLPSNGHQLILCAVSGTALEQTTPGGERSTAGEQATGRAQKTAEEQNEQNSSQHYGDWALSGAKVLFRQASSALSSYAHTAATIVLGPIAPLVIAPASIIIKFSLLCSQMPVKEAVKKVWDEALQLGWSVLAPYIWPLIFYAATVCLGPLGSLAVFGAWIVTKVGGPVFKVAIKKLWAKATQLLGPLKKKAAQLLGRIKKGAAHVVERVKEGVAWLWRKFKNALGMKEAEATQDTAAEEVEQLQQQQAEVDEIHAKTMEHLDIKKELQQAKKEAANHLSEGTEAVSKAIQQAKELVGEIQAEAQQLLDQVEEEVKSPKKLLARVEKTLEEEKEAEKKRQAEAKKAREAEAEKARKEAEAEKARKAREAEAEKAREAEAEKARKAREAEAEKARKSREAEAEKARKAEAEKARKEREAEAERASRTAQRLAYQPFLGCTPRQSHYEGFAQTRRPQQQQAKQARSMPLPSYHDNE